MKAIFLKEWREAHLLPWAGLLISTGVVILYGIWLVYYTKTGQDVADLGGYCLAVLALGLPVLLLVSTSGLIAAETGSGALSYLLSLPVSRTRIWLGKTLAALALAATSAVLLLLPASIAIPSVRQSLPGLLPFLPDMAAAALCAFAITTFCSTLFTRTLTVFVAALVVAGAMTVGILLAVNFGHCYVLAYDTRGDLTDLTMWELLITPPFLLGSWAAFRYGQLLDFRAHWRIALPVAGAGLVAVVGVLYVAGQWEHRYVRWGVSEIAQVSLTPSSDYAAVIVRGNPAPVIRDERGRWQSALRGARGRRGNPRSEHVVLVNVSTGKETVWNNGAPRYGDTELAPSPDGRWLAESGVLPAGETRVQVWEVATRRRVLETTVPYLSEQEGRQFQWSAEGEWLSWTAGVPGGAPLGPKEKRKNTWLLAVSKVGGTVKREVLLWESVERVDPDRDVVTNTVTSREVITAWVWAPDAEAMYLLTSSGELSRYDPATGTRTVLWHGRRPERKAPWGWNARRLAVSPDGRRVAISMLNSVSTGAQSTRAQTAGKEGPRAPGPGPRGGGVPTRMPREQQAPPTVYQVYVLSVEGETARPVSHLSYPVTTGGPWRLEWSGDGGTLFLGLEGYWREGMAQAAPLRMPTAMYGAHAEVFPFGEGLLISCGGQNLKFVADADGKVDHLSRTSRRLRYGAPVAGVDAKGRVIAWPPYPPILALSPGASEPVRVYP